MIKYQKQPTEKDIPVRVICNKTGKEVDLTNDDYISQNLIHNFKVSFYYGSDFDMETWEFDLNEDALLEFVRTFKVMPTGFAAEAKYPDKVFEEWKETGRINWKAGWTEDDYEEERKIKEESERKAKEFQEMLKDVRKNKKKNKKGEGLK